MSDRDERWFWAVSGQRTAAVRVLGFACTPEHPGAWWVPLLGYTGWEGRHLHDTPQAAVDAEVAVVQARIERDQNRVSVLRASLVSGKTE